MQQHYPDLRSWGSMMNNFQRKLRHIYMKPLFTKQQNCIGCLAGPIS